jgi:hypothetical protein
VNILPHLEHDDRYAGVLAERHHLRPRDLGVLQDLVEDDHTQGRLFAGACRA